MENRSRRYVYQLRAPATLVQGAGFTTLSAPCKGAAFVIFHFKATNSQTLAGVGFNYGNATALMFSGGGGNAEYNIVSLGTAGQQLNLTDGAILILQPTAAMNGRMLHNFVQAVGTATAGVSPGNDLTGFEVTAEVVYDDDCDSIFGQVLQAV